MELSGIWRAAPAREELRRTFHEPALDDRNWTEVEVPGHWANTPGLANERSVLFRHHFEMEPVEAGRRRWITLHGLAQQGDVWLNGAYVGDTDGYFVPHRFEVTHLMGDGDDHLVAVDVTVPTFGFGISPRGPRILPSPPTTRIASGAATTMSKLSSPFFTCSARSSMPTMSAPASVAASAAAP